MTVFFHLPEWKGAYVDAFVPLAEGLKVLGINLCANRCYWREGPDSAYLLQTSSRDLAAKANVCVYSNRSFQYFDDFGKPSLTRMDWLDGLSPESLNVLIDNEDGYVTACTRFYSQFSVVLRSHFNRSTYHTSNVRPWVLGLSNRVLDATQIDYKSFSERKPMVLVNFGASHGFEHGTRTLFTNPFLKAVGARLAVDATKDDLTIAPAHEYEALMWAQTQRRHSSSYYKRLAGAQAIATFCGEMIPSSPFRPTYLVGGGRAKLLRKFYDALAAVDPRPARSIQWDSWRFWEGLAAGCLVFNIDLDYYGVQLPVMPVNGQHYVGLRLDCIQQGVDEVLSDPARMESIAKAGREWVIEHYSPVAMAERFLQMVDDKTKWRNS